MDYYGVIFDEKLSKDVIDKVKICVNSGRRGNIFHVRKLKEYINGEYKYTFKINGSLEAFDVVETIYKK